MRISVTTLVICVMWIGLDLVAAAQSPQSVDYDTFWQRDLQGRLQLFAEMTPENRVEVVKTHGQRWLDANRARLTKEQVAMMDESLAFLAADQYRQPPSPELMSKLKDLENRTAALFSREDMRDAMTIYGTYIPKKK